MRSYHILFSALLVALCAACGRSDEGASALPIPAATLPAAVLQPTPSATASQGAAAMPDAQGKQMAEKARQQLAASKNIPVASIQIVAVEAVDWPDSSLGCAAPGQMALQVITPGYRVKLSASGQAYTFHTDHDRLTLPCDRDSGAPVR